MIKIEIVRDFDGNIISFRVAGHSRTAPRGQDIVCAGISALTQTAVIGLERYVKCNMTVDIAPGKLNFELIDNPDKQTNAILETMRLGLIEIANLNTESVRITEHRR